ncbi:MAG: hypothetical protein C0392_14880 [Syntrophus sp. (in: bacteria)]|nr:hypothetical protein [Syntrophus sp. (in: bacteria)]
MNKNAFMKIVTSALSIVVALYFLLATFVFTPLYNWQYARDNGFVKWVMLGELVATVKAFIWPYYFFANRANTVSTELPELNASEAGVISRIFSKSTKEALDENDMNELKHTIKSYHDRTGRQINKAEIEVFTSSMEAQNDYFYEWDIALLQSWDNKSKVITPAFEQALKMMRDRGLRKPHLIKKDLACIDAAVKNQSYFEDEEGSRFPFGRELILQNIRETEVLRANYGKIRKVFEESSA